MEIFKYLNNINGLKTKEKIIAVAEILVIHFKTIEPLFYMTTWNVRNRNHMKLREI